MAVRIEKGGWFISQQNLDIIENDLLHIVERLRVKAFNDGLRLSNGKGKSREAHTMQQFDVTSFFNRHLPE